MARWGRWEWKVVVRNRCLIFGFYTYATKSGARAAAKKVLRSIGVRIENKEKAA